jgi:hypothetical protein
LSVVLLSACGTPPAKKARAILLNQQDDTQAPSSADSTFQRFQFGMHSAGWEHIPVVLRFESRVSRDIRDGFLRAAASWNDAVVFGLLHFDESGDAPNYKGDLYNRLDDTLSTIGIENHWCRTGKPHVVLGTTIWEYAAPGMQVITDADVVLNTDFYHIGDGLTAKSDDVREVVDAETLALHELGHLIGLSHIPYSADAKSVMSSVVNIGEGIANRSLSEGDIRRIRYLYLEDQAPPEVLSNPEYVPGPVVNNPDIVSWMPPSDEVCDYEAD